MLVEADPRTCTADEATAGGWCAATDTPIRLLNWAWQTYLANPDGYRDWERGIVEGWLTPVRPPQSGTVSSAEFSDQRATAGPRRERPTRRRRKEAAGEDYPSGAQGAGSAAPFL